MKRIRVASILTCLAIVAAACGGDTSPETTIAPGTTTGPTVTPFQQGELIKLDVPPAPSQATQDTIKRVVAGDAGLGLDLLVELAEDDNFMLSPYSIAVALSMLYAGARGTTAQEIAAVMSLTVEPTELHEARRAIEEALAAEPPEDPNDERAPFTVRPANSAWGQGGFPFSDDYLRILATHYDAGLRVVDFVGDPDGSSDTINEWVADTTEDRIKNLVPLGAVTPDTRLVLVNAIWFKANWAEPFAPEATKPAEFTLLDGTTVTVPTMHANRRGLYTATDRFEAIRLPYAGDASMIIMLPSEGTSPRALAESLTADDLELEFGGFEITMTLPKFSFESEAGLSAALQSLGMREAFNSQAADLSGITDATELFVQDALHKSFIAVDENGTEAAAATALIVGTTSLPPPAEFIADRPFLFWIEQNSTGEMLFLGQVTNPAG